MRDSERAFAPELRRFARRELDAARHEEAGCLTGRALDEGRALGLFGLTIPERWGGLGLSLGEASPVIAVLAEYDRSFATTVGLHAGLGTRALVELASPELGARYLPSMARGETIGAFAATEPGAGSDLGSIRTEVRESKSGVLRLHGEKCYVTNGGLAGVATVLARTPGRGGGASFGLVLVPLDQDGVERGREEHKLGLRASSTLSLHFDGVVVEPSHLLGRAGGGLGDAHSVLCWGRTLMAAGCVGTGRAALAAAASHVTERAQFGRALVEFEMVRSRVAAMAATLHAMECTVEAVGEVHAGGRDLTLAASVAKVVASEGAFAMSDEAIQLHGALGFLEESGVPRLLRDCRVTRIFEGANDVLMIHLATRLLAMPSSDPELLHVSSEPRTEALRIALLASLSKVRRLLSARAAKKQLVLERLGRARAGLFVAEAILARQEPATFLRARALAETLGRAERALAALDDAELEAQADLGILSELGLTAPASGLMASRGAGDMKVLEVA